jgi:Uri superfamily endonuclease
MLATVQALLGSPFDVLNGGADSAPVGNGAYALLLHIRAPVDIRWRGTAVRFEAGCYVYAGSANGPGGIRARLRHHLRRGKRPHWHIDHLTNVAGRIHALAGPGAGECHIVERLVASDRFLVPFPGFGSSDCRDCLSHLLRFNP